MRIFKWIYHFFDDIVYKYEHRRSLKKFPKLKRERDPYIYK